MVGGRGEAKYPEKKKKRTYVTRNAAITSAVHAVERQRQCTTREVFEGGREGEGEGEGRFYRITINVDMC